MVGLLVRARTALARCLKALPPGDQLIVWKLDHARRPIEQGERPATVACSFSVGRSTLYRALQRDATSTT